MRFLVNLPIESRALVTHQLTLTILYFNHTHNPHSEGALGVKPQRLRMVGQGPWHHKPPGCSCTMPAAAGGSPPIDAPGRPRGVGAVSSPQPLELAERSARRSLECVGSLLQLRLVAVERRVRREVGRGKTRWGGVRRGGEANWSGVRRGGVRRGGVG